MSKPLRFKPVNPAHEMVYSADGGWVSWEDYQSLKDTLQCSFNSNRELKAEVDELKSQPDPLTAYLYADTLRRDEIKTLKAHIKLLTDVGDAMAMMVGHVEVKGDAHRMMLEFSKEWNAAKEGKAK